jgi:hypothetical protein
MAIKRRPLGLEILGDRQARLDRRRLERLQNETRDQRVERRRLQRLTERLAVAALHLRADVAGGMAVVVVMRQHRSAQRPQITAPEKRASGPHRPAFKTSASSARGGRSPVPGRLGSCLRLWTVRMP